jgi:hypothetical protein
MPRWLMGIPEPGWRAVMTKHATQRHNKVTTANAHNAALAREILAKKHAQDQQHHGGPPLTDDTHHAAGPNPNAPEQKGNPAGERNLGGGH